MGCDTGHPRDFRHDSGGGGDAGYDPSGGGGGGHSAHFDHLPDTFHAEFITQVTILDSDFRTETRLRELAPLRPERVVTQP